MSTDNCKSRLANRAVKNPCPRQSSPGCDCTPASWAGEGQCSYSGHCIRWNYATFLSRCCVGCKSPAAVCSPAAEHSCTSSPAAEHSRTSRGPLAAPILRARRREFISSSSSAAPSRERGERDAAGVRRRRVLRHLQLRGLGPEAHARVEHVHAQVSRRVGRSVVGFEARASRDGAPASRISARVKLFLSQQTAPVEPRRRPLAA